MHDEPEGEFPRTADGALDYSALALSGGGSDGAFGAGFLNGWTQTGHRPTFKLVTGISTGALIAPFAFLGSDYDETLKKMYTTISTPDIIRISVSQEALTDSSPLLQLIEKYVDESILAAVAEAQARGHRLYIGTTHLDADRLVVWNMGSIAANQHPDALGLFHKVMLASASIPGAFPPVLIPVEIDGKPYDEMHVDGGVKAQVFTHAAVLNLKAATDKILGENSGDAIGRIYILRNGRIVPHPEVVPRKFKDIAGRSISVMIKQAALNDLYRIYSFAQRDQLEFYYVDIPNEFEIKSKEPFDRDEMNRLFELGYQKALSENPWRASPPGLMDAEWETK